MLPIVLRRGPMVLGRFIGISSKRKRLDGRGDGLVNLQQVVHQKLAEASSIGAAPGY